MSLLRTLLGSTVLAAGFCFAAAESTPSQLAADALPLLSQIDVTVTVSLDPVQSHLRQALAQQYRGSPDYVIERGPKDGRVKVTADVRSNGLTVSGRATGNLVVSLPVAVTVTTKLSTAASLAVYRQGCRNTTFTLSAEFQPTFSPAGKLQYRLGNVWTDNGRYTCKIVSNVAADAGTAIINLGKTLDGLFKGKGVARAVDVNIASMIRDGLVGLGKKGFGDKAKAFNKLLPAPAQLRQLLEKPAMFGGAVTLGIDAPRLRVRSAAVKGREYRLTGSVEGRPRLRFGDDWAAAEVDSAEYQTVDGFRLPARLLFPTDPSLLPDASAQQVSGCLGGFRLAPVPDRQDMAVLQRCSTGSASNVIWLSGAGNVPPSRGFQFDRRMSDVFTEIIAWLNDPDLWGSVDGIARLRNEVAGVQRLLQRFQEDTRIPVDQRGSLHFYELAVDLDRIWVTKEAILADVMLHGKAKLDIRLDL